MSKLLLVACQGLHSTSVMLPFNPTEYQHNKNPLEFETDANYYRVFTPVYISLRLARCLIFIVPTKQHNEVLNCKLKSSLRKINAMSECLPTEINVYFWFSL